MVERTQKAEAFHVSIYILLLLAPFLNRFFSCGSTVILYLHGYYRLKPSYFYKH
jgi:hypothetical protein